MNIIVCIDDRGGLTFNSRRLSRDREIYADIADNMTGSARLLGAEYSRTLFDELDINKIFCDDFLDIAEMGDVCFVENRAIAPYLGKIESITVYHWNRHYPSDTTLDVSPEAEGFRLFEIAEFAGYSHEKITKEIYKK